MVSATAMFSPRSQIPRFAAVMVQPAMEELRKKFKDDPQKQQQELLALYQREKVNPLAGCLPIFLQIPVFFTLFKVLQLAIDMRHAPFVGYIRDLSAPDPTTVFGPHWVESRSLRTRTLWLAGSRAA